MGLGMVSHRRLLHEICYLHLLRQSNSYKLGYFLPPHPHPEVTLVVFWDDLNFLIGFISLVNVGAKKTTAISLTPR